MRSVAGSTLGGNWEQSVAAGRFPMQIYANEPAVPSPPPPPRGPPRHHRDEASGGAERPRGRPLGGREAEETSAARREV